MRASRPSDANARRLGSPAVGVVVIGRNEGERPRRCLASRSGLAVSSSLGHIVFGMASGAPHNSCRRREVVNNTPAPGARYSSPHLLVRRIHIRHGLHE